MLIQPVTRHIANVEINRLLKSRNFGDAAVWVPAATPVLVQDQTGIDGKANTAWTVQDDNALDEEKFLQTIAMPDDRRKNTASIFILKDNDETRFPAFYMSYTGGTPTYEMAHINTKTGAYANEAGLNQGSTEVQDWGLWWRAVITLANNGSGNVNALVWFWPARSTTIGVLNTAATGSCVIDWAQLEFNRNRASSPIFTDGAARTQSIVKPVIARM